MASLGTYKVPAPLKDEDKWFKFFTKTQLICVAGSVVLGVSILVQFCREHKRL